MKYICLLLIILLSASCNGSSPARTEPANDNERRTYMMADAAAYARSLEAYNIDSLVEFTLPAYLEMMGGKEKYLNETKNSPSPKEDFSSTSIVLKDKGILVKGGNNHYYSVLEQEVTQQLSSPVEEESVYSRINVVAESQDGGKNWKFAFMTIPELKQYYSPDIVQEIGKYLEY